ncbi:hypothetical protein GE253_23430 [Niveispirillum sp. SYP-B3756]|uniref:hypothetical protein n=1 Tax=Niveispirillum sp. SYP-B3756 TaxID=2662178 RepID=UPI001291DC80|nr:hypothetical protein [Niveispirillum sp. SYP-B3756]MQP68275.1 hypothetical protein [Niveispirillum sp. SYP-B3756]
MPGPLSLGVLKWHWALVQDKARNTAYEAALARVVQLDSLVLDLDLAGRLIRSHPSRQDVGKLPEAAPGIWNRPSACGRAGRWTNGFLC